MSFKYSQPNVADATRFSKSPMAEVEFSKMVAAPTWLLPFNGGDIVPCYVKEVLPHETVDLSLDFIVRQTTLLRPVMGNCQIDIVAFFAQNRVLNESWKNVQGENTSGVWAAPEVELAPLYVRQDFAGEYVKIDVGSIADYYGFPTQRPIHASVLEQCHDLKFRGYLEIYNNYFRDENYEPPIPYSKLNVYNGFFLPLGDPVPLAPNTGGGQWSDIEAGTKADGSYAGGAVIKSLYGDGATSNTKISIPRRMSGFSALDKPLKANKLHDYFTSVLPSPQKGADVYFGLGETAPVRLDTQANEVPFESGLGLLLLHNLSTNPPHSNLMVRNTGLVQAVAADSPESAAISSVTGSNLVGIADLSQATGVSINDLRNAIAVQQVYETLARGGSRYVEALKSFFEIETENPFGDIPIKLGHIRRDLDNYQVAQTSASIPGETPQGNLTAFGYTTNGGHLFNRTFLEHGYIHVFCIVRQRNVYSSYFSPDNFRRSTMDFYLPQFANIGEQPLRKALLNPFTADCMEKAIGYQEAWAEYRYEPDRVHGLFRSGIPESLDSWTLVDEFDPDFDYVDGNWLKSNAEEVINRTVATSSALAPQFKGLFKWRVEKQLPMPTYSIPGLDTI